MINKNKIEKKSTCCFCALRLTLIGIHVLGMLLVVCQTGYVMYWFRKVHVSFRQDILCSVLNWEEIVLEVSGFVKVYNVVLNAISFTKY